MPKNSFKILLVVVGLFSFGQLSSQPNHWAGYGKVGLNRIGVLYELGTELYVKESVFKVGARLQEPNLNFEKITPGLAMGYAYNLPQQAIILFHLGIDLNLFHENKDEVKVLLFDPKLFFGATWHFVGNFNLQLTGAIGPTITRTKASYLTNIQTLSYLNYEIALALKYNIWSPSTSD